VNNPAVEAQGAKSAGDVTLAPGRSPASARLVSLDVFRGATIASMMLVNNPGSWSAVYPPLLHAEWHGWTFTDVIFPFFLWIVGLAMTLSFARRVERGDDKTRLLLHVLRRSAIIFALGLFLAGFPYYHFSTLRIPGVLQRIAVCYLVASVIFLTTRVRGQVAWTLGLLASYWLLMKLVPVPGYGAGVLEKVGNFAQWVDSMVLSGHMWASSRVWDPEGIVSTIPAIATTLFGILTGHILRLRRSEEEKTAWIFLCGSGLMWVGSVMSWWLPINKSIWTSSYSVFMAGLAATVFAACYWLVDVRGYKRWVQPFVAYGMNAITVFVLSGLVGRTLGLIEVTGADGSTVPLGDWIFNTIFAPLAALKNASLLYAVTHVILLWGVAAWLYRRRLFLKV